MNSCGVCGTEQMDGAFAVREMMYGSGDVFHYFECCNCRTIQLIDPPDDLDRYYAEGYYAHGNPVSPGANVAARLLHRQAGNYLAGGLNPIGWLYFRCKPTGVEQWVRVTGAKKNAAILDVGCGNGGKLVTLAGFGFHNLLGIDPYLQQDKLEIGPVTLLRGDLEMVNRSYDLVMMHHSFEHLPEPAAVMRKLAERIKPGGWLLLRLPVGDCHAWREYREHWFRLDAPRHFFIHTRQGMRLLAEQAGLKVEKVIYDSSDNQFINSELYRRGISLMDKRGKSLHSFFDRKQLAEFRRNARRLNQRQDGDAAAFYLRKPE